MRRWLFVLCWVFVLVAAAYDSYFAYSYRMVLDQWEFNPLMRWAVRLIGLTAVFGFKAIGLTFAISLALYCRRHRLGLERPLTLSVAASYLLLSLHYAICHASHEMECRKLAAWQSAELRALRQAR